MPSPEPILDDLKDMPFPSFPHDFPYDPDSWEDFGLFPKTRYEYIKEKLPFCAWNQQ